MEMIYKIGYLFGNSKINMYICILKYKIKSVSQ